MTSNSTHNAGRLPILALVGPTAVGKTALSLQLAHEFGCEIVSVDSMQVYKYMDIGTAKIKQEEMEGISHHLLDLVDPDQDYDAAQFVRDAETAIKKIWLKGKTPLLTGGTGLYLKAFTHGLFTDLPEDKSIRISLQERADREGISILYKELSVADPDTAARVHPNDAMRVIRGLEIYLASSIPWSKHLASQHRGSFPDAPLLQIALYRDREDLYNRINMRSELMLEQGLEEEVQRLLAMGYEKSIKSMQSIGYRHILNHLDATWTLSEALEFLKRDTRRYAKRQLTWFRAIEGMEWHPVQKPGGIMQRIGQWLASLPNQKGSKP